MLGSGFGKAIRTQDMKRGGLAHQGMADDESSHACLCLFLALIGGT